MQRNFKAENNAWERASVSSTCLFIHSAYCTVRLLTYAMLLTI